MNSEDYVSYELSKALKKAGFEWDCEYVYAEGLPGCAPFNKQEDGIRYFLLTGKSLFNSNNFSAPTLWEAQKWLREIHGVHVEPKFIYNGLFDLHIASENLNLLKHYTNTQWTTYESALAAGVEAALKLIEKGERWTH